MKTRDFYFDLPEELIAQKPSAIRGQDKLMLLDRSLGDTAIQCVSHHEMKDLPELIDENTLMVFNNSKVRRSRCFAEKLSSVSKPVEFMILEENKKTGLWKCMIKNAKKQKPGNTYCFSDGTKAQIVECDELAKTEFRYVKFDSVLDDLWFERNGHIPLPPYIRREDNNEDAQRYQNVYAKETGSSACPTAGLHFTLEMLETLKKRGIYSVEITLHVGLGTFLPVRVENVEEHKMHEEVFSITEDAAKKINEAKLQHKKILAVGTTSVRTLESAYDPDTGLVKSGTQSTNIFIYPGKKFNVIDQLFTNFHTPESTLMMLVSALAGRERILDAYQIAVQNTYRFFSYGDAMFIK
jgi:S-adenosylmethionine:tRNA ribosyltransferase-isomerase